MPLKIGTIVQLLSGGPEMTVEPRLFGDNQLDVRCTWFSKNDDLTRSSFDERSLKVIRVND